MDTYIGTAQARPRVSTIWLAILAFAVAVAIVIAMAATMGGSAAGSGGTTVPGSVDTEHTLSRVNNPSVTGGSAQIQITQHRS